MPSNQESVAINRRQCNAFSVSDNGQISFLWSVRPQAKNCVAVSDKNFRNISYHIKIRQIVSKKV